MALSKSIYNTFIKRNYIFVGTIFASAFAFEILFDKTTDKIWDNLNKGVRYPQPPHVNWLVTDEEQRQWKDIRHRYVQEE